MREGTHPWELAQGIASRYVLFMPLMREPSASQMRSSKIMDKQPSFIYKQAVLLLSPLSVILDTMHTIPNTPPQVDISACRNIRRNETRAVGETKRGPLALVIPSRLLHFFAVKKTIQLRSSNLVAPCAEVDDLPISEIVFLRLAAACASQERDCSCYRPDARINEVQTCRRHDDRYRKRLVWRAKMHTISTPLVESGAEDDKKKKENQPKPEKPKPEKPKPDRKGDKGSRRVKRPKVQGLAFSSHPKEWWIGMRSVSS